MAKSKSRRYEYSCAACKGEVTKPPVQGPNASEKVHGLHGWSCVNCGNGIKIIRKIKFLGINEVFEVD